jgi:hypothetical protein
VLVSVSIARSGTNTAQHAGGADQDLPHRTHANGCDAACAVEAQSHISPVLVLELELKTEKQKAAHVI